MAGKARSSTKSYRLPNGMFTNNAKELERDWSALAAPICSVTGAYPHGYDPGVSFYYNGRVIDMPVSFIEKLNSALKRKQRAEKTRRGC